MPSPFIHVGFALGFGSLLMAATRGQFTPIHCLVLTVNGFFGPDIGAFVNWYFEMTFPSLANISMRWIHHSLGYIILIGPFMSVLLSYLTRKIAAYSNSINKNDLESDMDIGDTNSEDFPISLNTVVPLSLRECYLLAISGALLHFQIDHLFEENGEDRFYRWILSTGYFNSKMPPLSPITVGFVGICTFTLFVGFAWIHIFSPFIAKQSLYIKMRHTFYLFLMVFSVYLLFLYLLQIALRQKAVVGEEADLGVLIFITIFHFTPFILCLLSINS